MQQDKFRPAEALLEPAVFSPPSYSASCVLLSSTVGVRKNTSAYYPYKLNKSLELIEELQSTSVNPDEIPGLLPVRKIAPKKANAKRVTQVCGSMRAKEMLSKVQEMKAQEKEKEEKRKKDAQKREDIKIAFMRYKDKCVCDGKRKCAAVGLKMYEVCSNVQSTCGKAACKTDGKRPMMILPACSQSTSAGSKRKLWYDQSEFESPDSDISEQSNFSGKHDVGHGDESEDETNYLEEIHYEDVKLGM